MLGRAAADAPPMGLDAGIAAPPDVGSRVGEGARLAAVRDVEPLDARGRSALDGLARIACELLGVPVSLVSLVEADRQVFAGSNGVPEPWAGYGEAPLSHSLCKHVVADDAELVVGDAASHPVASGNLAVRDLGVAAYAGVPVRQRDGLVLGALCAIDRRARAWSERDVRVLRDLAGLAEGVLELYGAERGIGALRDRVTGLPDRSLFVELVARALERMGQNGGAVSVVALGLDGFRLINEALGHAAGDQVLVTVAGRLTTAIRASDAVTRLAGDEFLVLCDPVADEEGAAKIAERLRAAAVTEPGHVDGRAQPIAASVGVATATTSVGPAELIEAALASLAEAKEGAGHAAERVDPDRRTRATTRLRLRDDIARAPARQELHLAYQPLVDLHSGRIRGLEALLRWDHPELGPVPPSEFIPAAEATGAIVGLGEWVLARACVDLACWRRDHPGLGMAVNVASAQLATASFVGGVRAVLERDGLPPEALTLEITERALVDERAAHRLTLEGLHELGVRIALDDFGTGYSALSYLTRFPIDIIKIDRSFVAAIAERGQSAALVEGILGMARGLHLDTVAEGIETLQQLRALGWLGCAAGQGYLLARPMGAEDVPALLRTGLQPRSVVA